MSFVSAKAFHFYDPSVIGNTYGIMIAELVYRKTQDKVMSSIKKLCKKIWHLMIHMPLFICIINIELKTKY